MKKQVQSSKIINDPVHGFIELSNPLLLRIIDHQVFQRLRRIKQLGLSSLVYPGAVHTRFNHALGAMHLTQQALDVLRSKQVPISEEEYEATLIAILLHDLGHGPFSHALEHAIIPDLKHERMSLALMESLNRELDGRLSLAIQIFEGKYERQFLHQLVSSQLDMDRMDYLIRDSFFTGVAEGIVGIDRIIKILNVLDDGLVCESKGIYSVEKFIIARRLMYWQVYLHKAAVAAEYMMLNILKRARQLAAEEGPLFLEGPLAYFFRSPVSSTRLNDEVIQQFIRLDDNDIEFHIKKWRHNPDRVLAELCDRLLNRQLLKVKIREKPFGEKKINRYIQRYTEQQGYTFEEARYFVFHGEVANQAYLKKSNEPILIWYKTGKLKELAMASDMKNIQALSRPVVKNYLCHPAEVK